MTFLKHLLLSLFCLGVVITANAQSILERLESDQILQAHRHLNTSKDSISYTILHHLLKTSTLYNTKVKSYTQLAQYFLTKEIIDSTLFYNHKAEQILLSHPKDTLRYGRLSRIYNINAITTSQKGLLDETISWHLKGIEVAQKGNDTYMIVYHKHGLANAYRAQKKFDQALTLFEECLQSKHTQLIYASHLNIGAILAEQHLLSEANSHYQMALTLCKASGDIKCMITAYLNIGSTLAEEQRINEALEYYDLSKKLAIEHGFLKSLYLAKIHIAQALIKRKNFRKAESLFLEILQEVKDHEFFDITQSVYHHLLDLYTELNQHKKAYEFLIKKTTLEDSLKKIQQLDEIQELEIKYHSLRKEKEIVILKKDQELQSTALSKQKDINTIILIASLITLCSIIILLIVYYQKLRAQNLLHTKQKEINTQNITSLLKEQELNLIKASVQGQHIERKRIAQELHDSIGGNLAAIKLQFSTINTSSQDYSYIYKQIDDTYELVRSLSHNLFPKKIKSHQFLILIKEYLQNIGNASHITIHLHAYPEIEINTLDQELQQELFTILQELLTNTIKHAEASTVDIHLHLIEERINILFEDNGKGFNFETTTSGIGLSNIKSRLHYLNGTIHIDSHPKRGSIINIELPLKPNT